MSLEQKRQHEEDINKVVGEAKQLEEVNEYVNEQITQLREAVRAAEAKDEERQDEISRLNDELVKAHNHTENVDQQ